MPKRKRDREATESSRSSKKHKHSSPKRDYRAREDLNKPSTSRRRNRQSVSQALALQRHSFSATLQDAPGDADADASILFVDGPTQLAQAGKEASLELQIENSEPEAEPLVVVASSAPLNQSDIKVDQAIPDANEVKPDVKPVTKSKKSKGKSKEEGWAPGLSSQAVVDSEVTRLKAEVERMSKELLFKDEILSAHRSVTTFLQDALNCSICLMTFVDPLSCGHVFCRKCLKDCFTHQRARNTVGPVRTECPSCRNANITRPFPVFLVRDLTTKMKLLEAPEGLLWTGEENSPGRKSVPLEEEDEWHGFFPTQDRNVTYAHAVRRGLIDAEDGIQRCVNCNWEIEDGMCLHCGEQYDDGHLSDLEDFALDNGHDLHLDSFRSEDDEGDLSDLIVHDETLSDDPDTSFAIPSRRSAGDQALRQAMRSRYGPSDSESSSQDDEGEDEGDEVDATVDLRNLTQQYSDEDLENLSENEGDGLQFVSGATRRRNNYLDPGMDEEDDLQYVIPPRSLGEEAQLPYDHGSYFVDAPRRLGSTHGSDEESLQSDEDDRNQHEGSPDVPAQFQRITRHATSDGIDPEEDSEPIAPRKKKRIVESDSDDDVQFVQAPVRARRPQLVVDSDEELEYAVGPDESRVARYGSHSPGTQDEDDLHLHGDIADGEIGQGLRWSEDEAELQGEMAEYSDIEEVGGGSYGQPQAYMHPDVIDSEEDFLEGRESDAEGSLQMDSDGQLF